ncbi:MAG: E3 ubiquitin-protein ligase hrd1 [Alyxoria varia]|nr:MAG: E3 ubiquitin-protein ligase hrd1 [Alyxoria varia]
MSRLAGKGGLAASSMYDIFASAIAAVAVILRAFHERPNFYSAAVYMGESNACRMILLNMLLLSAGSSVYGLQRLVYGSLRAIEIEQLWEKSWYAITETALAMTTFRDEVGGWFFIMFMTLLAGKIWGWIAEGRVETLEQQPPANPRLFHARLLVALFISEMFDLLMLRYCMQTLLYDPRPGMMVMFAFEFAVLAISSTSTTARYLLTLQEKAIIKQQTMNKVAERREEIRLARQEATRHATENPDAEPLPVPPEREEDVDGNEFDVPGWQEKGRYILFLDLATGEDNPLCANTNTMLTIADLLKLGLYLGFFMVLLFFSGIPIHMFRDLWVTTRSFVKRINDYLKYRNATKDMNSRYPDATAEELDRDGTCIICREEMKLWQDPTVPDRPDPSIQRQNRSTSDERQRPKKLPCGHILHFGCLKSWLERQQVCPTCRRSVLVPDTQRPENGNGQGNQANQPRPPGPNGAAQNDGQRPPPENDQRRNQEQNGIRARSFNLGALRLTFATGNPQQFQNLLNQRRNQDTQAQQREMTTARIQEALASVQGRRATGNNTQPIQDQLSAIERQITQEINNLNAAQDQLAVVRALQGELTRLRAAQNNSAGSLTEQPPLQHARGNANMIGMQQPNFRQPATTIMPMAQSPNFAIPNLGQTQQRVYGTRSENSRSLSEHTEIPEGMTLPNGWSILPLQRLGSATNRPMPGIPATNEDSQSVLAQWGSAESGTSGPTSSQAPDGEVGEATAGTRSASEIPHRQTRASPSSNASMTNRGPNVQRPPNDTNVDSTPDPTTNALSTQEPTSDGTPSGPPVQPINPNWTDTGPPDGVASRSRGVSRYETSMTGESGQIEEQSARRNSNGETETNKGRSATVEDDETEDGPGR